MVAFHAVVLAAGQGTRMKSRLPKVLHPLAGLPLVSHVLSAAAAAGARGCSLVIPPAAPAFAKLPHPDNLPLRFFEQRERLGTAHAVLAAREELAGIGGPILVLYGDTPLVAPESLMRLAQAVARGATVAVMGFRASDPKGYGRLIVDGDATLAAIREEKDATPEEREVTLCNSGIMAFDGKEILNLLYRIENRNKAGEYYLTDAVEIARALGQRVGYEIGEEDEVRGINTRAQLAEVEAILQRRLRLKAMAGGATLIAPERVTFAADTVTGQDVLIEPDVFFGPGVRIADDVTVKAFSHIEGAYIAEGCVVGPFARLRPGARLDRGVRVGNFVEVKEAVIRAGAKINHLSYIGDADVGARANIGARTITCNYDGFRKHRTEIGADAFIGSNTCLVAPVRIGEGAYIGSGSVIGRSVPAHALAITRAPLVQKEDWAKRRQARGEKAYHSTGGAAESGDENGLSDKGMEADAEATPSVGAKTG